MDGIFVAYHNTQEIFGFQYISLAEMDQRLFGGTAYAEQAFALSMKVLQKTLDLAVDKFRGSDISLLAATTPGRLEVFASPLPEDSLSASVLSPTDPAYQFTHHLNSTINGKQRLEPFDVSATDKWTLDHTVIEHPNSTKVQARRNELQFYALNYGSRSKDAKKRKGGNKKQNEAFLNSLARELGYHVVADCAGVEMAAGVGAASGIEGGEEYEGRGADETGTQDGQRGDDAGSVSGDGHWVVL
ncbi:mitochondrial protein Pet127-domain-containing protein [Blyttiomyces helicus]|uniref:Mitochondrial protein Pet127-domain-containing protein n=1 Tax=Blyttiomyces helicus TaxID=388810 RepID=A0A4P9W371_9FUNG|nr:mitochondrial protein Pet127-domain-containing protein [Blyttiomyces helicus]|eukprot:RKO85080.1 mitochondrial protein Pet127-domain-containing protein [Blyttiomyces helicus]